MTGQKVFRKDEYFARTGYVPHDGQKVLHYTSKRFRVVSNGRRWGKGLKLSTLVPTPTGWTTVEKLQEGDQVFGADGQVIQIIHAIDPYWADTWRIAFDDGTEVIADDPHRWEVHTRYSRTRGARPIVMTTAEMRSWRLGIDDLSIHVAGALQMPRANLSVDPYLLGRWLGDGSTHRASITSLPDDSEPLIVRGCRPSTIAQPNCGRASHYLMPLGNSLAMRQLGVIGNKHIPGQYLRASELQRRQLLAGLIDSDGAREGNRLRFSQSNKELFDQVVELVHSLGYKAKLSQRIGKFRGVEKKVSHRLTFYPEPSDYVAEVNRKKPVADQDRRGVARKHRRVRSIEPTGQRELVRCFTVSSEDHLWLVGSQMIPTHNTLFGAKEVEPCGLTVSSITGKPQTGWIVGPQFADAEKEFRVVYDTFRKLGIDKHSIKFVNNVDNGSMVIKTNWGFELLCKSAKHPETLVGEGLDFVLMVEAGRHRRRTWGQYLRPALSDKRGWAIFSGVPEGRSENSLLFALWARGQDESHPQWGSWRMPSWTNNIVFPGGRNDPEIKEAESDLTEDEFMRQYGAMFVEKTGTVMQEWDDEVHWTNLRYNPSWPVYGAVDYGFTNPFVWLWIQVDEEGNAYVIRERRWTQKDTLEIANEMKADPIDGPLSKIAVAFYPDPAEPDDTLTVSRVLKIPNRGNTGGELKTRLSIIRSKLKTYPDHLPLDHPERRPRLLVDRQCASLRWEMAEGYKWPEHRSEVTSEKEHPMDKDNHGVEALGRFMRGYYGMPGQRKARSRVSTAKMGG